MPLEYPIFSNVPHTSGRDPQVDLAWRAGHAACTRWMNSSGRLLPGVSPEKPKNPYLEPFNGLLCDAWEEGFSGSLNDQIKGRGF